VINEKVAVGRASAVKKSALINDDEVTMMQALSIVECPFEPDFLPFL